MAKGKRSNSPKRSRRGGKRSPKKSKGGVQKKISKSEADGPAQLHEPKEVEDLDCECDLPEEGEAQQELPKMADEVPVADVSTIKANLVQFFWESLEEDAHAGLKIVSQLDEHLFFFGKVAAEIAKTGKFTEEVESNLAEVWKADEAWIRSYLAGEIELPKPEEPAPEEQLEQAEEAVEEVVETADVEPESKMEVEAAAEVAVEAPVTEVVEPAEIVTEEKPEVDDVAMEGVFEQPVVEAPEPFVHVDTEGSHMPESMEEIVSETALDKENTANMIAFEDAVKTVSAKIGEQSVDAAPVEGLAPKDLNLAQPLDLA